MERAMDKIVSSVLGLETSFDDQSNYVWHDREIRFDLQRERLQCRSGEFEIDAITGIEDTKGNNGERGALIVTNLRLIWTCVSNTSINLSIGFNCIHGINIHKTFSKLRGGQTQALFVLTKFSNTRYEFIFTNLVKNSPRLFTTVQAVFKAYETTKLYREVKLRTAIIQDKDLILLPKEQVFSKINGVWNLSSEQGNLGTFIISNVRVVWFAELAENFNVSIPFIQMKTLRIKTSKFGPTLVFETYPASGNYVLGFKIDPQDMLKKVYKELTSLHQIFCKTPIFGVDFEVEEKPSSLTSLTVERKKDDVDIIENDEVDVLATYASDNCSSNVARDPVFSPELGLAIEKLPDGLSIHKLWSSLRQ